MDNERGEREPVQQQQPAQPQPVPQQPVQQQPVQQQPAPQQPVQQQPTVQQPPQLNTAVARPPQPFSYTAASSPQTTRPQTAPSQNAPLSPSREGPEDDRYSNGRDRDRYGNVLPPLPPLPLDTRLATDFRPPIKSRTVDTQHSLGRPRSAIDYIVPIEEKAHQRRTVGERLEPTLSRAIVERDKYAMKAKMSGYALNAAIGTQVLLGALTTGLSAVATTKQQAAIATTVLGGLATLVASYLARARGSNEPELSITRKKDLEQFIRECQAFQMDHGHILTDEHDEQLLRFRSHFEELLGNASGERKLSSV